MPISYILDFNSHMARNRWLVIKNTTQIHPIVA